MADPGFPRGGGANSPGGAPTYDFAKFSQKLHEMERIWTPRGGGARPKFYYVDPPLLDAATALILMLPLTLGVFTALEWDTTYNYLVRFTRITREWKIIGQGDHVPC